MVALAGLPFREVWAVDFEFIAPPGERPAPVCMVALELRTGKRIRLWREKLSKLRRAPFDTGPETLFVAYYASAEIGCFLALGWPIPERILDLFTEFRAETNGAGTMAGNGLLGALAHFGLPSIGGEEKNDMRTLIMGGGPWRDGEQVAILDYCESDVQALGRLLPEMEPMIVASNQRLGWALLRGRYMAAVASMEWNGIPIDIDVLRRLNANWERLQLGLIEEIDQAYGVYEARSFRTNKFEAFLIEANIPWPRLDTGRLALSDHVFRAQAKAHPIIAPLRELRHALSELKLNNLAVGADGRNRTLLSPFRSKTARNQPSNSKFIFGPSVWLRGLIKPSPGKSVAYLDWSSQEMAIAAALSGDQAMWGGYATGDPYIAFAIQAGMAPAGATKHSHKDIRNRCKAIVLGVQYGMSAESMAFNAGIHVVEARELLLQHKETYRTFWGWANQNVNAGLMGGTLYTRFGWPIRLGFGANANSRSLLNWPMQSNGAEMMRLACCEATEVGLKICAPIHDALLLEAPTHQIDNHIHRLTTIMQHASELVLGDGRTCGIDVDVVHYPNRYSDERGEVMWDRVMKLLPEVDDVLAV
jgi:DNA polymerase-1